MSESRNREEQFPVPLPWRLRRELRLRRPPWWLVAAVMGVVLVLMVPVVVLLLTRGGVSDKPRVQLIQDMGVQPRFNPQAGSTLFADGRAMRLPVEGTIHRGGLEDDDHFHRGYELRIDPQTEQPVLHYFDTLPPQLSERPNLLARGSQLYAIHCMPCHGGGGTGDGIINQRAMANQEPAWVAAVDLLSMQVREQPDGYHYNVIRHGVRSMPPLGAQIDTEGRWAIVAHLRQLQRQADEASAVTENQEPMP